MEEVPWSTAPTRGPSLPLTEALVTGNISRAQQDNRAVTLCRKSLPADTLILCTSKVVTLQCFSKLTNQTTSVCHNIPNKHINMFQWTATTCISTTGDHKMYDYHNYVHILSSCCQIWKFWEINMTANMYIIKRLNTFLSCCIILYKLC